MSGEAERAAAVRAEWEAEERQPFREHTAYVDEMGNPDECTEDCPGCHWEGNRSCEALASGCDICDPDGVYAYAPENAEKVRRIQALADELDAEARGYAEEANGLARSNPRRGQLLSRALGKKAAAVRMREVVQ